VGAGRISTIKTGSNADDPRPSGDPALADRDDLSRPTSEARDEQRSVHASEPH
jgi:hypothetical protein